MVIGVVLQSAAAIFGSVLILITIIRNGGTLSLEFDRAGLFWSCMAGLAVGLAEILSFCISGMGVNATQSIPIVIGGSIVIGTNLVVRLAGHILFGQWHLARCNRSWPKLIYNEDGESDAVFLLLLETYFRKSSTFSDPAY